MDAMELKVAEYIDALKSAQKVEDYFKLSLAAYGGLHASRDEPLEEITEIVLLISDLIHRTENYKTENPASAAELKEALESIDHLNNESDRLLKRAHDAENANASFGKERKQLLQANSKLAAQIAELNTKPKATPSSTAIKTPAPKPYDGNEIPKAARPNKNSSSRFKYVCFHRRERKWIAQVSAKYLGLYASDIDAAIATQRHLGNTDVVAWLENKKAEEQAGQNLTGDEWADKKAIDKFHAEKANSEGREMGHECTGCGAGYKVKPDKCPKCNGYTFEESPITTE